jgi:hypothetical protein
MLDVPNQGIALDGSGRVFVCAYSEVQVLSKSGQSLDRFGSSGTGPGQLGSAVDLAVSREGDVYVVDDTNHRVQRWGPAPVRTRPTSWGRLKSHYR